ncbi:MAG: hypothetical protein HYZ53_03785 [Planctomycetes bacterium]|nr:hypothetical protein [Planctomycetota bacterium]
MSLRHRRSTNRRGRESGLVLGGCLARFFLTVLVLVLLGAILLPILASARKQAKKSDCANSLRQLHNYLVLYVSRYGGGLQYPTTVAVGGNGAPVPVGDNGAFWSFLYRVPSQTNAVSQRPGDDGLYVCKVTGT